MEKVREVFGQFPELFYFRFRKMETIINHPLWGQVHVGENPRARSYIFRIKSNELYVTVPPYTSRAQLDRLLEQCEAKLRQQFLSNTTASLRPGFVLEAPLFKMELMEGETTSFFWRSEDTHHLLLCPKGTAFESPRVQAFLRKAIEQALMKEARRLLPARLAEVSQRIGLHCRQVSIRLMHSRWGSCSTQQHISLSCYLLLLPVHLLDSVLIHELCHTREMNHGEHFWALMDRYTDGKAQRLRQELKNYRTGF